MQITPFQVCDVPNTCFFPPSLGFVLRSAPNRAWIHLFSAFEYHEGGPPQHNVLIVKKSDHVPRFPMQHFAPSNFFSALNLDISILCANFSVQLECGKTWFLQGTSNSMLTARIEKECRKIRILCYQWQDSADKQTANGLKLNKERSNETNRSFWPINVPVSWDSMGMWNFRFYAFWPPLLRKTAVEEGSRRTCQS